MEIHVYTRQGDIIGIKHQLASGVDIDCVDEWSKTPLMYAVNDVNINLDMVRFLVENGADVNAVGGKYNQNVLGLAVKSGNLEKIQYLLDVGAEIHYQSAGGCDVLIDAMYGRDISKCENLIPIVNLLIDRGAKVNGVNEFGHTALKAATYQNRFDVVELLMIAAGADQKQLKLTKLMHAIVFSNLDEIKRLIEEGADLEARDSWNRTPWLLSIQVGSVEKARLFLDSGANQFDCGHCDKPPVMYAIESNHIEILEWLIEEGFDTEATNDFGTTPLSFAAERGATDFVQLLLEAGEGASRTSYFAREAIHKASNLEIVKMLVDAGADLSDINNNMRRLLTGNGNRDDICNIFQEQYFNGKYRRFGKANPEVMEIEFWQAMVQSGIGAWGARKRFDDTGDNVLRHEDEPVWCFDRFGRTITQLPDGRIIEIGGEHEDSYDPDFCIYNDVVVYQGDGKFTILGYPKHIFPPTDFHSATLVREYIYIIGCLGYRDERIYNETPVYRLHSQTFKIEKIETTGEKPGWINQHKAYYQEQSQICITGGKVFVRVEDRTDYVENDNDYILDLKKMSWNRVNA
jgi:ankyrin repeat protein